MGAIFSLLFNLATSRLGALVGWAGTLALAAALTWTTISAKATEHSLNGRIATLQASIDDPRTGWRARLAQSEANIDTLSAGIIKQNGQIEAWKTAADQANARAAAANSKAHTDTENAVRKAVVTLGLKPGADHCASALELIRSR